MKAALAIAEEDWVVMAQRMHFAAVSAAAEGHGLRAREAEEEPGSADG